MTKPDPDPHLADRYGAPNPVIRRVLQVGVGVLVLAFAAWVVWVVLLHGDPEVDAGIEGFEIVDPHTATAVVDVRLSEDTEATCVLRASAEDKVTVGERTFTPTDGKNEVTVRTERTATTVDLVGCTVEE
ncbi:DUF4307 domain-containing protein [Nocardioides insulae]|uniref:DUF4307 domain-containing protein n=1 Tax=Nocardioides insulae TaxID=394734 RepID=UPI0004264363|nr:DUF4307 domain-containing protein [Nocardioides insulae]